MSKMYNCLLKNVSHQLCFSLKNVFNSLNYVMLRVILLLLFRSECTFLTAAILVALSPLAVSGVFRACTNI